MPVSVVLDHPHRHILRRAWSALIASVGGLMVIAGLAASLVAFALSFLLIWSFSNDPSSPDASTLVAPLAIATTLMVSGLAVGISLLRGKRAPVLFLRRFGYTDATQAITFAVSKTLGRSWRLVTLDDAAIAPVGVATGTRRLFRAGSIIGAAFMTAMRVAPGFFYVAGGAFAGMIALGVVTFQRGRDLDSLFDYPRTTIFGYPRPEVIRWDIPSVFYVLLVVMVVALLLGLLLAPAIAITVIVLFPILAIFWIGKGALERAEKLTTAELRTVQEIEVARALVAQESRKLLAPRLVVLKVASNVWQQTVHRFATVASVLLFDVSEPTDNLLWEIEELTGRFQSRCIFVGQYDRVRRLAAHANDAAPPESLDGRLSKLLDDQEVLGYVTDRRGMKRFARALGGKLQTLALAE